jgi:hypothetical protein
MSSIAAVLLAAWLAVPVVSVLAAHPLMRENFSVVGLRRARGALVIAALILSFLMLVNFDHYRDALGRLLDRGYWVEGSESERFLVRATLYVFEWVFLAVVMLVPLVAGVGATMAVNLRKEDSPPNEVDAEL